MDDCSVMRSVCSRSNRGSYLSHTEHAMIDHYVVSQTMKSPHKQLFYKRNARFWKFHFFWGRLYATGSGIIQILLDPMSGSVAPGKMDRLNLCFSWRRGLTDQVQTYIVTHSLKLFFVKNRHSVRLHVYIFTYLR